MSKTMITSMRVRFFVFLCFLGGMLVSFHFSEIKYEAIRFHAKDYAFYLQFASKLFDDGIEKVYSFNPNGDNCLFFSGTEGTDNFHQTIHFEPIKYFYAVLYAVFGTPKILFFFISFVFFLPCLYSALLLPMRRKQCMYMALFLSVLYILYPASILVPSYDLRPYIFLAPFFLLSFLSIAFSRSWREIALWFNVLFLAREESLILGLVLLFYAVAKWRGEKPRHVKILLFSWLFWLGAIVIFVYWCGYPTKIFLAFSKFRIHNEIIFFAFFLVLCTIGMILAAMPRFRRMFDKLGSHQHALETAPFVVLFIPLTYIFCRHEVYNIMSPSLDWLEKMFCSPRYFLYFVILLCFGIIVLQHNGRKIYKKVGSAVFFIICLFFFMINTVSPHGIFRSYSQYKNELEAADKVWAIRNLTNKYETQILVDQDVYQVFCDYRYVYVYNRLPWHVIPGPGRFYPANSAVVQRLVDEHIEYVVASMSSYNIIDRFLAHNQLAGASLFTDSHYFGLRITSGPQKNR